MQKVPNGLMSPRSESDVLAASWQTAATHLCNLNHVGGVVVWFPSNSERSNCKTVHVHCHRPFLGNTSWFQTIYHLSRAFYVYDYLYLDP